MAETKTITVCGETMSYLPEQPAINDEAAQKAEYETIHVRMPAHEANKERFRRWCFTWNNYTAEDVESIKTKWIDDFDMTCVAFEPETGKNGTKHLQGFFITKNVKTFKQIKTILPKGIHFEMMRRPIESNIIYCNKEGKLLVIGKLPASKKMKGELGREATKKDPVLTEDPVKAGSFKTPESRAQWAEKINATETATAGSARDCWRQLQAAVISGASKMECMGRFPELAGRYTKGFNETLETFKPKPEYDIRKMYEKPFAWEVDFLTRLQIPADDRTIIWVYSKAGGTGKSEMTKHLIYTLNFEPMSNGRTIDLACAWNGGNVVFDYARDTEEASINYAILEMIKNRLVFSAKYQSGTKASEGMKKVFVVCFANKPPDVANGKMSNDRWEIYEINPDDHKTWSRKYVHERDGKAWIADGPVDTQK